MNQYNYKNIEIANHLYQFLIEYVSFHLYSPSYEEIRNHLILKSNTSIIHYLNILVSLGYITYDSSPRSISLLHFHIVPTVSINFDSYCLSEIDQQIYLSLCDYIYRHNYSPSYDDIAHSCNFASKSSMQLHLRKLSSIGLIQLDHYPSPRCIHLNYHILLPNEL